MTLARMTLHACLRRLDDPVVVADPFPWYASLRRCGPLVFEPDGHRWVCTAYQEARAILGDQRGRFGALPVRWQASARECAPVQLPPLHQVLRLAAPFLEGPLHRQVRRALQPHCSPQMVEQRTAALQQLIDEQVAVLAPAPHEAGIDLLADFAEPLARAAQARFLTLPSDSLASLSRWGDAARAALAGWAGYSTAQVEQLSEWLTEALEYFARLVKARRLHPQRDLVSHLLQVLGANRGVPRSAEQEAGSGAIVVATLLAMLAAGSHGVAHLIAMTLLWLWREPALREQLEHEPALWPAFLKEVARLDGPQHVLARQALQDVVLSNKRIRRGQTVLIVLAAADRDRLVYAPEPDACRLDRDQSHPPLAFGWGPHACLGEDHTLHLVQMAASSFLRQFPAAHLAVSEPALCWKNLGGLRLLQQVPVALRAPAPGHVPIQTSPVSRERKDGPAKTQLCRKPYTLDLTPDGSTAVLSLDLAHLEHHTVHIEVQPEQVVVTTGEAGYQERAIVARSRAGQEGSASPVEQQVHHDGVEQGIPLENGQQERQRWSQGVGRASSELEAHLCHLFSQILDRDPGQVDRDTDFFEAGGDSLDVATLLTSIHEQFQIDLDPFVVFDHPILGELLTIMETLVVAPQRDESDICSQAEEAPR